MFCWPVQYLTTTTFINKVVLFSTLKLFRNQYEGKKIKRKHLTNVSNSKWILSMQHKWSISKENICTTFSCILVNEDSGKIKSLHILLCTKLGLFLVTSSFTQKKHLLSFWYFYAPPKVKMHILAFWSFANYMGNWKNGGSLQHIFLCPHFENDPPLSSNIFFNFLHPAFHASSN